VRKKEVITPSRKERQEKSGIIKIDDGNIRIKISRMRNESLQETVVYLPATDWNEVGISVQLW
jgi:hypothetical protein